MPLCSRSRVARLARKSTCPSCLTFARSSLMRIVRATPRLLLANRGAVTRAGLGQRRCDACLFERVVDAAGSGWLHQPGAPEQGQDQPDNGANELLPTQANATSSEIDLIG